MAASKLDTYKVFYNKRFQLRTIVGSSEDTVIVAFRGSAVATNFWTDAQILRKKVRCSVSREVTT